MKRVFLNLIIVCGALLPSAPASAQEPAEVMLLASVAEQAETRREADRLFESGDYPGALAALEGPALAGDKYAQFRTSLIHYFGLAGEADKIEAYGWAAVAQEEGITMLQKYAMLVAQELGLHQTELARERFYELDALAGAMAEGTRSADLRLECTGSRLGKNCGRVDLPGERTAYDIYGDLGLAPYAYTEAWITEFDREYGNRALADFDRLDRAQARN